MPSWCSRRRGGPDRLGTALRLHLLHDSVDVILDGELREIEPESDLFIGQALGNKRNKLLLTDREAGRDLGLIGGAVSRACWATL